ncbi:uncharacterized protein LA080_001239 [Diaporthe eres]|nr:uncharacterized protein LA080_001239 [Diaporthe eres]
MTRRVKEDARLVAMDRYSDNTFYATVNSWMDRGNSKLKRLEDDASRVRQSLVTLLSLKQREVNAESLINSEIQSQILFVFTAATVLFTPLSWVCSLLALDIEGFTPTDSKWSIEAAAVSSSVTVASFVFLMLLCLLAWRWKSVLTFAKKLKADSPKRIEELRLRMKPTVKSSDGDKPDAHMSPV